MYQDFTDDTSKLKAAIDAISSEGGSYTKAGIKIADGMLKKSTTDKKILVVAGDGDETYSALGYPEIDIVGPYGNFPNISDLGNNLEELTNEIKRIEDIIRDPQV